MHQGRNVASAVRCQGEQWCHEGRITEPPLPPFTCLYCLFF